jgi:hypothetical protein
MTDHLSIQTATPEDAAKRWECPVARTFGKTDTPMCRGPRCAAWRFLPLLASDPSIVSAVQREMQAIADEQGEKKPAATYHKKAVERVMRDPSAYAIPSHHERGFCGLGPKP